jgi:hypothetical protein
MQGRAEEEMAPHVYDAGTLPYSGHCLIGGLTTFVSGIGYKRKSLGRLAPSLGGHDTLAPEIALAGCTNEASK